jgi:hypothetical protein
MLTIIPVRQTTCVRQRPYGSWVWLALVCLVLSVAPVAADNTETYTGEGVGILLANDFAATRGRVLQEAFRDAIERAVADLAEADSVVAQHHSLRTRLYPKPLRYIRSYRVLWEYPDPQQKVYRVAVEAEILIDMLGNALSAMGIQRRRGGIVRVAVLITERQAPENVLITNKGQGVVAGILRSELRTQGFRLIDNEDEQKWNGQESSALSVARRAGARVVVIGVAEVQQWRPEITNLPQTTVRATVSIRALSVDTGEELTYGSQVEVVSATDANQGGIQALQTVAVALAAQLAPVLETLR